MNNNKNRFIKVLILLGGILGVTSNAYSQLEGSVTSKAKIYKKGEVFSGTKVSQIEQPVWKGEKVINQLILWSSAPYQNISYEMTNLTNGSGIIPAENVSLNFLKYVKTDKVSGLCGAQANRDWNDFDEMADILTYQPITTIDSSEPINLMLNIDVPQSSVAGDYSGFVHVKVNGVTQVTFSIDLQVVDYTLPVVSQWTSHLDLWQFPGAVLEQYNQANPSSTIDYWSPQHFALVTPLYTLLADLGQDVITAHMKDGALGGKSMIKWIKTGNNWSYDYSGFDGYVELLMSLGINKQINSQSVVGWNSSTIPYFDQNTGTNEYLSAPVGGSTYNQRWDHFLTQFKIHLDSKGWFDKTYIYMDEVPESTMTSVINMIKGNDSNWKIGLAATHVFSAAIENQIDDLSMVVGKRPVQNRDGKITTFYTPCGPTHPNNFVISDANAAENIWMGWHSLNIGMNGFLRWAYDNFDIENTSVTDARLGNHNSGDFFLSYRSSNDIDMEFYNSLRAVLIRDGMQDIEKVKILKSLFETSTVPYDVLALQKINAKIDDFTYASGTVSTVTPLVETAQQLIENIVTNEPLPVEYCSIGGSGTDYHVGSLTTTGGDTNINFTSSNVVGGYESHSASHLTASPQSTVTVGFVNGSSYGGCSRTKTWVDWNQDGDFSDLNEEVYADGAATICNNLDVHSVNLTVPADAVPGQTKMRVKFRDAWSDAPLSCGIEAFAGGADFDLTVTAVGNSSTYCMPSPAPSVTGGGISRIEIIANQGSGAVLLDNNTTEVGYDDQTNVPLNISVGTLNRLILTTTNTSNNRKFATIEADFNQDGDFDDVGESMMDWTSENYNQSTYKFSQGLVIPSDANLGNTRLRVIFKTESVNNTSTGSPASCGNITYGEIEDMTINVIP